MDSVHCTLYTVRRTLYVVQCTVYTNARTTTHTNNTHQYKYHYTYYYNGNTIVYFPHTTTKDFAKQRYNTPYACNVI